MNLKVFVWFIWSVMVFLFQRIRIEELLCTADFVSSSSSTCSGLW